MEYNTINNINLSNLNPGSASVMGGTIAAFIMSFLLILLFILIVVYLYFSICLYNIAKKTNTSNRWAAWVPIVQIFYPIIISQKPWWWIFVVLILGFFSSSLNRSESGIVQLVSFLISITIIVVWVYIWMGVCVKLKRPNWWGVLMMIPLINIVFLGILAFSNHYLNNQTPTNNPLSQPPQTPIPPKPEENLTNTQ